MTKYNYNEAIREDVRVYIRDNYSEAELKLKLALEIEDFEEDLNDKLFICDEVTGNMSGSYTLSTWDAEENICHNYDLIADICDEFGYSVSDLVKKGAETIDVIIRCYLLPAAIDDVLDELYNKYFSEV